MNQATIGFLVREGKVCLGMKKRDFGKDKYNGFGGKVGNKEEFKNETVEESLIREGTEEFGIVVTKMKKAAELVYEWKDGSKLVHVFVIEEWEGEPRESDEMRPEWFDIAKLPFEQMWDDDKYWVSDVLTGNMVKFKFVMGEDGKVLEYTSE